MQSGRSEYRNIGRIANLGDTRIIVTRAVLLLLAGLWRRLMFRTTFIAVTGSLGKTTAKNLIAAVLSARFPVLATRGSSNHYRGVITHLLKVRPWHRFAVIEIGIDRPGQMKWFAMAVRPDIAVWLSVGRTHTREYTGLPHIAREKGLLIEGVKRGGVAILNDDDPLIHDYRAPAHLRIVRVGLHNGADLQARNARSVWPERLSFEVCRAMPNGETEREQVLTQLVGTHWVPGVLASIAVGMECGLTLAETVGPIASVEPAPARLQPAVLANGAVVLRDEFAGSSDSLAAAYRVFEQARAIRKILVLSDVSDSGETERRRAKQIGLDAARLADVAVLLGKNAKQIASRATQAGMNEEHVHTFLSIEEAADFLKAELRSGDLVLLRGRRTDKMSRLYLAFEHDVSCWRATCNRKSLCDVCPELVALRKRV